jgi:hypothetical protein
MSKSEKIIQDWHDAKKIYTNRFPHEYGNMTMVEIVKDLIESIDDLKSENSYLKSGK